MVALLLPAALLVLGTGTATFCLLPRHAAPAVEPVLPLPPPAATVTAATTPAQHDPASPAAPPATADAAVGATTPVVRTDLTMAVRSSGQIAANQDVEVKCQTSGLILLLPFDVCDPVKKGDLLAQLDPTEARNAVRQAEIQLSASETSLGAARENLAITMETLALERRKLETNLKAVESSEKNTRKRAERQAELFKSKLSSQEEYENCAAMAVQAAASLENALLRRDELKSQERQAAMRRQEIKIAETAVERDTVALAIAQTRLEKTRVTSPIDGVVTGRTVQAGQVITSVATTILTISDLSRLLVTASIAEANIGHIRRGQPVNITVDAFPDQRFGGKIERISPRASGAFGKAEFEMRVEILDKDRSSLKPGLSARTEIVLEQRKRVLAVPLQTLRHGAGGYEVEVVREDKRFARKVKVSGFTDGRLAEILSGVKEGEMVCLEPAAPPAANTVPTP